MKEYIVQIEDDEMDYEEYFVGYIRKQQKELIRCEDCKWGREICGNIECNADKNNPPEYHGYGWFCPFGERKGE